MRALVLDELDLARRHARLPGLGRPHRPAPRGRAPRPLRPRRRREHVPARPGDRTAGEAFLAWQRFSQDVEHFPVGQIINGGCTTDLSPEVIAAYDAPFPDETYKAGARQFPMLVPTTPGRPRGRAEPRRVGGPRAVGQAVPHRVQRRRPDHQGRRRACCRRTIPGAAGPAAHDDRRRRPLPAGGPRPGARRRPSSTSCKLLAEIHDTTSRTTRTRGAMAAGPRLAERARRSEMSTRGDDGR